MRDISPAQAAQLADEVYAVQAANQLKYFLDNPVFKKSTKGAPPVNRYLEAEVGGRVILNTNDGFGVCAQGVTGDELFLVFRGTTSANRGADFLTDARIGIKTSDAGLPVHVGFDHCFSSMLPEIRSFFSEHTGLGKTVHCIGHSLGGAIASLAADWVSRNTIHTPKLYTFGAPRVGTDWFVKSTTSAVGADNIHRTYHRTDPVPMVPLYPFMHAPYGKVGHFLFSTEALTSGEAHKMGKYIKSVKSKSWEQMNEVPENPYTIESAIESWLRSKSPVDADSASFWRWVDSALIYVLKKVASTTLVSIQGAFVASFTIADKIAYILAKGIELADNISVWVQHLMRKLMQALGMKVTQAKEELTYSLMRYVLERIIEKINKQARNALRRL